MKTAKRMISFLLALVLLAALCLPAVAEGEKTYRKYMKYVCLGDSIAAGCSLGKDGYDVYFDPTVEDPLSVYNDDVLYLGLDFAKVPNAYHSIVADALGSSFCQCARSAMRTVEIRYFLDGIYVDIDNEYIWGKQFLGDDLNIERNDELDVRAYLDKINEQGKYAQSLKGADVITINLGSNDVFSYPIICALNKLAEKIPFLTMVSDLFKQTGNIGTAFAGLLDASNTAATAATVLAELVSNVELACSIYETNYRAILDYIYEVNPDATVLSVGLYNPLKNTVLSETSKLNVKPLAATTVARINAFLSSLSLSYPNHKYVDVTDTDVYHINMDDPNAVDLFLLKAHPTIAGHAYMAEQILSKLPDGLAAARLSVKNRSSDGKISLSWKAVDGASSYKIYRSNSRNGTYKLIGTAKSTSYTDTSATNGVLYYYKISASDGFIDGSFSNVVYCRYGCKAPTVSSSIDAASGKVKLSWNKVTDAVKYEIWRAAGKNGTYKKMYTTTKTSYTNTLATAGKTYYYKVRAVDAKGVTGAFSNVTYRTCDCARPVVSSGNDAATGKITLSWKAVDGAGKYEIWRASSKNGTYKKMYTTTKTSYTNTSSVECKTYYYKVKALSSKTSAADSAFSAVVSRMCDLARPEVRIFISGSRPKIAWDPVEGADEYAIYRSVSGKNDFKLYYLTEKTSFGNTSAIPGYWYYYKVVAINYDHPYADSAYSKIVGIKP